MRSSSSSAMMRVLVVLALLLLWASPAWAHLMPRGKGTVNVVGQKAYIVVSLPVAAFFKGAPSKTTLSQEQLKRDEAQLRAEVRAGLRVASGDDTAVFDQVLLSLPTGEGHDGSEGEDLLVMVVARFSKAPIELSLTNDLWASHLEGADKLVLKGTVSEGPKTLKTDLATLTESQPNHVFFAPKRKEAGLAAPDKSLPLLAGAILVVGIGLVSGRLWLQRSRPKKT